jgi:hypothetical protein
MEVTTYIRYVEGANKCQMSHGSVIWQHHEVEACRIVVHDIWRDDRAKIEEVGVDFFDFCPNSLERIWFHAVNAKKVAFSWGSSPYTYTSVAVS